MQLRVQYKALRSFGRRLKPLGRTSEGHPLFVVDSLKLALPRGARHFHRVLACSRCGTELVEWDRAVSRPYHLEARPRERLCESCSQLPAQPEEEEGELPTLASSSDPPEDRRRD